MNLPIREGELPVAIHSRTSRTIWGVPPSSILDVVAYNCFLEVVPAVISVLGVSHLSVGHTAHGANVRLNALFLVVWNGHCGQVNCQVLFEDVVELDVFLELGSRSLLCNRVLFLWRLTLKHGAKSELTSVQFVDVISQRYYLALAVFLAPINSILLLHSFNECLKAPDLALDPVVDVDEWVGVLLSH